MNEGARRRRFNAQPLQGERRRLTGMLSGKQRPYEMGAVIERMKLLGARAEQRLVRPDLKNMSVQGWAQARQGPGRGVQGLWRPG